MKTPSLDTVTKLFNQNTDLYFVKFHNAGLASLNREISLLFRLIGDQKELSVWPDITMILKKIRFELATLPVPAERLITTQLITRLNNSLSICRDSFPDNLEQLSRIIQILSELRGEKNDFLNWTKSQCAKNNTKKPCLCLLQSRYVRPVEQSIKKENYLHGVNIEVTSAQGLKKFNFFNQIYFCGSISLFSENHFRNYEFVWRAPRASRLYFLSFDWIRDNFEPKPALDVKPNRVPVNIIELRCSETEIDKKDECYDNNNDGSLNADELDFAPIELILSGSSGTTSGEYDSICDSRLLMLEDGSFIYKEIESSSRIVEFAPQPEIKKIGNNKLETEMPLIVRTEGSGDSIAAVADMLFGKKSEIIRRKQDEWKIAFRKRLFTYATVQDVASILTDLGAPTANEINVRNWQRNDTIKPKNEEDFKAIMIFSGLANQVNEYWNNAREIDLMHKQAGKKISRLLLDKINDSSREDLEKYGRIDVEIQGLAGKVSVIRIESILPQICRVPSRKLNKVLNVEGGF